MADTNTTPATSSDPLVTTTTVTQASEPTPQPVSASKEPRVINIPANAMSRIKAEEREKGKRAMMAELDKRAKTLGYKNHEDLERALDRNRTRAQKTTEKPATQPTAKPAQQQKTQPNAQAAVDLSLRQQERDRLMQEKILRLNRRAAHEEKRRKALQRELDAKEAENALRLAAVRAGVHDVDYALHLLRRDMTGKTSQELDGFDEAKFFSENLRKSHPHLYGVESRPATTGTTAEKVSSVRSSASPTASKEATEDGRATTDARKMSQDKFNELLRSRGISNPITGTPG